LVESKNYSWLVTLAANVFIGWAVLGTILDLFWRYKYSQPLEFGIIVGTTGICASGLVALAAAKSLKSLEQRLTRLESARAR
jgi:hypothetical protein